ncbi:3-phosphoshikimate 1-carboxyvinyltransferase [Blattabacterium cuenoti]|uniref:3-phosphoshikimate 1-carboxyvinyltransferase n=1 Tax=Blattabacterium cuenoti TaxID=1653831 RepID=UPI00163B8BBC|nr:3-phosphoshikimate 1-carboxyvinyltransferase [Blattabacterium cuenoti]
MSHYIHIRQKTDPLYGSIYITGSKSISNRLLILKALYNHDIYIENISNCDDTKVLQESLNSTSSIIDIHHAGTAMRFLTSYLSIQEGRETILTGSNRMKERPILVLVETLKKLGSNITYLEKYGYPPIKIYGKKILGGKLDINAKISSQYISSLMLIASKFQMGLQLILKGNITSIPYIKMTFHLLISSGIKVDWNEKIIHIYPGKEKVKKYFHVESDWSSASYYYAMATISNKSKITLYSYNKKSLQGDNEVISIYEKYFGISTIFEKKGITLKKNSNFIYRNFIELDLNKTPDIAQTISVTCAAIGIKCKLKGLETLKIKETDRLQALKEELWKFGVKTKITNSILEIYHFFQPKNISLVKIKTYQDHRMAMAFSIFTLCYHSIRIENPNVVYKSYPFFWKDLKSMGFSMEICKRDNEEFIS